MRIKIYKIYICCIFLSIVFIPITSLMFNGQQLPSMLSEPSNFFVFGGLLFWVIEKIYYRKKINISHNSILYFLFMFYIFTLLSGMFNVSSIYHSFYNDTEGIFRFFKLFFGLVFYSIIYVFLYDAIKTHIYEPIKFFSRGIIISFYISAIYSIFEIFGGFLGISWMLNIMQSIDAYIHPQTFVFRLRSLALEPNFFSLCASLMMPWIIALSLQGNKVKRIVYSCFSIYLLLMIVLTASRAMYVVAALELIGCLYINKDVIMLNKKYFIFLACFGLLSIFSFFSYTLTSAEGYELDILAMYETLFKMEGESNIARYGLSMAAFKAFLSNPFFGLGFGQYPFNFERFLPDWSFQSLEVLKDICRVEGLPMTHSLYSRLLSEVGFFGTLFWLAIWIYVESNLIRKYIVLHKIDILKSIDLGNFLICTNALYFFWFSWDSLVSFIIWIILSIASVTIDVEKV